MTFGKVIFDEMINPEKASLPLQIVCVNVVVKNLSQCRKRKNSSHCKRLKFPCQRRPFQEFEILKYEYCDYG